MKFLSAIAVMLLPAFAQAADITGVPKIREGDHILIGNTRIRLGGIDAPSVDQLCLNTNGERWTCGVAARDELIKHADNKTWICRSRQVVDRRGRLVARCEVDGEDIQKWLVQNGWALSAVRFSHDYDADEKSARDATAGLWQGAFIAPWDWRFRTRARFQVRRPPENASAILLASASGSVTLARLHHQGNVNQSGECIYHQPQPLVCEIRADQQGHRWFCSVDEAEAAGCRETRR